MSRLVDGFETPVGLELLATVHWLVTREGSTTRDDVIRKTHAWGPTKRQFSESQVRVALEVLARDGWLPEDAFVS